jgi:cell division protein FtsB
MAFGKTLKRRLKALIAPAVFLAITGYFAWSATQGNRGLVAYAQRQELMKQVQSDNDTAKSDRDMWERRVAGLRSNHLNPDTLDERTRAMLNLADPTDVVVQLGAKDKLF